MVKKEVEIMKKPYLLLRIILGGAALANIVVGLAGIIPAIPLDIAVRYYGASLTVLTPQIEHICQMFGAFMLTVGLLTVFAIWKPVKNIFIIYGVSFLLFVRFIQRLAFAGQAEAVFGISPVWYWVQTAAFFAFGVSLILLRPKASESNSA